MPRARAAVHGLFFVSGAAIGTWTSRIPAIKTDLGLSDGRFSMALLGIAAGAITGMAIVGRLIDRYGSFRLMVPTGIAMGIVLQLPAYAAGLPALALSLFLFGVVHGSLDVAMNANAVVVERRYGRPIMSAFHAVFSVGGFAGASAGGLLAQAGAGPRATFAGVGAVLLLLSLISARWATRDRPPPAEASHPAGDGLRRRRFAPGVLFLGLLAFCCLVGEGASADWSSVYLRETLGSSPGLAAAAYAAFSIMMTAGRFAGDRLAARLGPVRLVRCCGGLAGAGLGVSLLAGHPLAGVAGFGLFGAGLSCIIPQVFSAAGHRDPAQAGRSLAVAAGVGYTGFLAGPVLIGGLAELVTLSRALLAPAVLALFVALAAPALRPPSRTAGEPVPAATGGEPG
ncbi:MFS transporter [Microbispora sp. RL4-1S]|uniref:MFS transporter n=1 Tax=Microbispora oryzae TaxID=2806554 RepID=A0A940WFM6_9ACTN|nr:MFS transporter [Microbispora oryzae]